MELELQDYETIIVEKIFVDQNLLTTYETELSKTFNNTNIYLHGRSHNSYYLAKDNLILTNLTKNIKLDDFSFAFEDWKYGYGYERVAGAIDLNLLKTGEFLELNKKFYPNLSLNFIDRLNDKKVISYIVLHPDIILLHLLLNTKDI